MSIDFSAIGPAATGPATTARSAEDIAALERRLWSERQAAAASEVALPDADKHQTGEGSAEVASPWQQQNAAQEAAGGREDTQEPPADRLLDLTA